MLAIAVARHLDSLGIARFEEQDPSGDCYIAHLPDGRGVPDEAVMLMPTGGVNQPTKRPTDRPTLQAVTRSAKHDPTAALTRWQAIYDALACLDNTVLDEGGPDEVLVIGCTPIQSGPVPMGQDEVGRHEFSGNFEFRIHHPTVHRPAIPA